MIIVIALLYNKLLFWQSISRSLIHKLSHHAYQQSNWYYNIISFFLDCQSTFHTLSLNKKKLIKQVSVQYNIKAQQIFFIKGGTETDK